MATHVFKKGHKGAEIPVLKKNLRLLNRFRVRSVGVCVNLNRPLLRFVGLLLVGVRYFFPVTHRCGDKNTNRH